MELELMRKGRYETDVDGDRLLTHIFHIRWGILVQIGAVSEISCGDLGSRICARIGLRGEIARFGPGENFPNSSFSRADEFHREVIRLIEEEYGYRVPFKEDLE